MELRAYLSYSRKKLPLHFWRTVESGYEVDFIIGEEIAIEVNATQRVSSKHLKGLTYLKEENKLKNYYLISQDPIALKQNGINNLPWEHFLKKLWNGEIIS